MTGGAELLVLIGNKLGIFSHEDLANWAQVKFGRLVAQEFAVNARPHQATI